ncbi:hypothetical protein CARUB_v10026375mg [Capsella rubella]|uniref:Uncharacterized protein n=1 Tax=Capsella rubella TaxID=81985 RepID=R0EWV1_9BRAS|nr:hypothetical protein CARUB_v10026375mg [Capsella rubella]
MRNKIPRNRRDKRIADAKKMATSLSFVNVAGISLPSSGLLRRRWYIVSRNDLPELSAKPVSSLRSFSPASLSLFRNGSDRFLSPDSLPETTSPIRSVTVRSLSTPLISPNDEWGTWTALFATGALGLWSEKTKVGAAMSGALVSTLVGLAASNLGIISSQAPAFAVVLNFLLPLAVPLLLFRADLRRVVQSTGKLLLAFLVGSVATTIGTALAYYLVPMRSLGPDSWKIAAALMGRHIGGAVNYVAISNALGVTPSVLAAGLAADNVICAVYFTTLFALGSKIPAEAVPPPTTDAETNKGSETQNKIPVLLIATGIAVSLAICKVGALLTKHFGISGGSLPAITAVVVVLATVFPSQFGRLAPSGEAMALILMQVLDNYKSFQEHCNPLVINQTSFLSGVLHSGGCKRKHMDCDKHSTEHILVCIGTNWDTSCCDIRHRKAAKHRVKAAASSVKC